MAKTDGGEECIEGAAVINCTGPNAGFSESPVALFQNLMQRGLIQPDPLDMGIEVAEDFIALNSAGERVPNLYVIGPLMKGTLWETTAVPELRGQAMRVAQCLIDANRLVPPEHDYRLSLDEEHVIEYYI